MSPDEVLAPQPGRAIGLYASLAFLPPLAFYLLPVSSQALGMALSVVVTSLMLLGTRQPWVRWQALLPLMVMVGLLLHVIVIAQWRPVAVGRFGGSALLLGAVLLMAGRTAPALFGSIQHRDLRNLYLCFLLFGLLALLGLSPPVGNATSKPVFPFSEASHFGLALCPILLSLCVLTSQSKFRLLYIGAALGLALTLQNFTLLAGLMLIAAVCLPLRWLLPLASFGVAVVVLALSAGADGLLYYTDRLNFGADSENLTALVVIQGWQMIEQAWNATGGWGIGLQQLGVQGATADVSDLIFTLNGDYLNLFDGGFLFAKLAGELGVFGVLATLLFVATALRLAWRLRRLATLGADGASPGEVFGQAVVVMYLLEIFVRSPGYLTGSAALVLTALCYLYGWRSDEREVRAPLSARAATAASR